MSSIFVGAWEGSDNEDFRGMHMFTETHHLGLLVKKKRRPFLAEKPTEAEEADAYRSMLAAGGTYSISGSTVTLNMEYHKSPDPPGPIPNITFEFEIESDHLTLKHVESGWTLDLQKVS